MKKLLLILAVTTGLVACSKKLFPDNLQHDKQIIGTVLHIPVVADLEVDGERTTGTFIYETTTSGVSIEIARQMAIQDMLIRHKADVIIEPIISVVNDVNSINVVISCYLGRYKNFRQMTSSDTLFMKYTSISVEIGR